MSQRMLLALGPRGTNGHEAAINFLEQSDFTGERVQFAERHAEIFARVAANKDIHGVVPIETTRRGLVGEVIQDFLDVQDQNSLPFVIAAEYRMRVRHHLLAPLKIKDAADLSVVFSHGEAIEQCAQRLSMLGLAAQPVQSTAHAAMQVADQSTRGKAFGALASDFARMTYGLHALEEDLQGEKENRTRFFLLSHKPARRTGNDKTAMLVRIPNKPGSLSRLIAPLEERGINMSAIHSIPLGRDEYAFYVEFAGHQQERDVRKLLTDLRHRDVTERLIVLGSFPRWVDSN